MRTILLLCLFVTSYSISAQDLGHPTCDGTRYALSVFTDVDSTMAVKFGEGATVTGVQQELFMDIYEPAGDLATSRPVIVLAFGGSFIQGTRQDMAWLCREYAKKGFVAVTMDYRLFDGPLFPLPSAEVFQNVVMRSVSDMKAVIRHLREDAATDNLYRIDPDYVYTGGISAGSIVALHTAYLDDTDALPQVLVDIIAANGGLEGNTSNNFSYSSEVQGVVNFSGALNDASWIDANDPPVVSVHEEFDGTVPYGFGSASVFGIPIIPVEGSLIITESCDSLGIYNELMTIEGSSSHVAYFVTEESTIEVIDFSALFLQNLICGNTTIDIKEESELLQGLVLSPNPTSDYINISSEDNMDLHLTLTTMLGANVGTWTGVNSIQVSDYNPGMYLMIVEDLATQTSTTRRIIIE